MFESGVSVSQPEFDGITPIFSVSDVAAALSFYRDRLGFEIGWTWGDPPTHANVCRGRIDITLTAKSEAAGSGHAYITVRDVDAYFAELRGRNVACGDLADQTYGMRDFSVVDPSGNRIVFGQAVAG
jgi:catechol 2,3-dioxygenase-like lactoylglutathione lyase family enzyme